MTGIRFSIREGKPFPLGANWDGLGVNFALFSAHATKVELCLFDDTGEKELERIELAGIHRRSVARLSCPRPGPGRCTAIAFTAIMSRTPATASIPTSC